MRSLSGADPPRCVRARESTPSQRLRTLSRTPVVCRTPGWLLSAPPQAAAADGVEPTGVSASDLAGRLELAQAEEERVRAAGARLEEEGYLLRNWAAATLYGGGDGGGGGGRNGAQQQAPPLVGISTVQAALDFVRARRTALDDELAAVRKVGLLQLCCSLSAPLIRL